MTTKKVDDFDGTSAAVSKSTSLNWGNGLGSSNTEFIQTLGIPRTLRPAAYACADQNLSTGTTVKHFFMM